MPHRLLIGAYLSVKCRKDSEIEQLVLRAGDTEDGENMKIQIQPVEYRKVESIPVELRDMAHIVDFDGNGFITSYELDKALADTKSPLMRADLKKLEQYLKSKLKLDHYQEFLHPRSRAEWSEPVLDFISRLPERLLAFMRERGIKVMPTKSPVPKASYHLTMEAIMFSVSEHRSGNLTSSTPGNFETDQGFPRSLIHEIAHALDFERLYEHPEYVDADVSRIGDGLSFRASYTEDFYRIFIEEHAAIEAVLGTYFAAASAEFFAESFVLHVTNHPKLDEIKGLRAFWDAQADGDYPLFNCAQHSLEKAIEIRSRAETELLKAQALQYQPQGMLSYCLDDRENYLKYFPDYKS